MNLRAGQSSDRVLSHSAKRENRHSSGANSASFAPVQIKLGYPFPNPKMPQNPQPRLDFADVRYKMESMKLLSKKSHPKHAYHQMVYHTTSNQSGLEQFNHGRKHFTQRVSLSRDEQFRPSLGKTKYSDRSFASNLKTPHCAELQPWATKKRRSEDHSSRLPQSEINQIANELPSMRERGSMKLYDKSKFVGQLDFVGLCRESTNNKRTGLETNHNHVRPARRVDPTRSDSSGFKRAVFGST